MAEVLRGLRLAYLGEAPERVRELSASLGRLRLRDRSALEELERYFHRLAGSGGSYGFPGVTTCSRYAEHAVKAIAASGREIERTDFEVIERAILDLTEAFQKAQQDFEQGRIED
jgi:chemotaxis protein histidine kinase CheA